MKKIFYLILATIVLSLSTQAQTTEGTNFWITFGQNGTATTPNLLDFQIRIVAKDYHTTGTIYFTHLGTYVDFEIEARQVFTYPLSILERQAVYNTTTGKTNHSIHITSTKPVSVYAMNQGGATTDATNILPVTALNTDYYYISYTVVLNPFYNDRYGIIAIEDDTKIFENGFLMETLNTGEVYYKLSLTGDMTGYHISSTKPIAVFALVRAYQLIGAPASDNMFHQIAPINTYGKIFFSPVSSFVKDRVRIVASQDETDIIQTGGTIYAAPGAQETLSNLQAGQFVELEIPISSNGCHITASKPVGVTTYFGGVVNAGDGAPAWLPPKEQSITSACIAPFIPSGDTYITSHSAILCTPTFTRDSTKVSIGGGLPTGLSGGSWIAHTEAGMSFYKMPLTNTNDTTAYFFTNPAGFLIFCLGVGPAESYYYLAYSAMRDLDGAFYANNIHFQDLKDNPFCEGLVEFWAEIDVKGIAIDTVKWYINGNEEITERNKLEWNKPFSSGNYEIKMWVHFENNTTISKKDTLKIKSCNQTTAFFINKVLQPALKDTTFCNKNVNFRAEIEGVYQNIKWFVDSKDGNGFIEETSALNLAEWGKPFENGAYEIKLVVIYDNGETVTLIGTLKVQALWIKIRNVRY